MKSYNSCDDPNIHPTKIRIEQEPVKSLLTGLRKISPSASAAFLVGVLEAVSIKLVVIVFSLICVYCFMTSMLTPSTIATVRYSVPHLPSPYL